MLWMYDIAKKIINNHPEKEEYICQCGISTTGIAHFGNYREPVITYAVAKAIEACGKRARCKLSFDDFDRYKRVASGTPDDYEKYIGMPDYCIPSPYDDAMGYAAYYEKFIIANLERLGIDMDYIYQHKCYLSGRYNNYIKKALKHRDKLFAIENLFKTSPKKNSSSYYPVRVYCEKCSKDLTVIDNYCKNDNTLSYHCDNCGNTSKGSIEKLKVKCDFKVDWPMRWTVENVDFEPAGKSHMEPMGAYAVSSVISRELFGHEPPETYGYAFVSIAGQNGRMSKTSGSILTMETALKLYGRDMVIWILGFRRPEVPIRVPVSEDVEVLYKQYEEFLSSDNRDCVDFCNLFNIKKETGIPSFRKLYNEMLMWGKSDEELAIKMGVSNECTKKKIASVRYFCEVIRKENCFRFSEPYSEMLSAEEKKLTERFFNLDLEQITVDTVKLYFDPEQYRILSGALNLLMFGRRKGPSINRILTAYDLKHIKKKIWISYRI
ncbi:MAG: lysine--tRNA ligase [Lachnospiraceae bacterium]|nr:lysine--tRNA ligase [Lachnospiraceae bacterium]